MLCYRRFIFSCGHGVERVLPARRQQTRGVVRLAPVRVAADSGGSLCPSCQRRAREQVLIGTVRARVAALADALERMQLKRAEAAETTAAADDADDEDDDDNDNDDDDDENWPAQPPPTRRLVRPRQAPDTEAAYDADTEAARPARLSLWIRSVSQDLERLAAVRRTRASPPAAGSTAAEPSSPSSPLSASSPVPSSSSSLSSVDVNV